MSGATLTTYIRPIVNALAWMWRRMAAAVAVGLIAAALVIGYVIGRPDPEPSAEVTAAVHEREDSNGDEAQMYTCSMHPSVRLPDPDAKCPICFMDLIPVTDDAGGEGSERRLTLSKGAAAMSRVETAEVGRFFPTSTVRLYGKVTYDETAIARLTAYFPGRIEELFVNYVGVPMSEGDHVAEMYSPDLLAAFEELRQAKQAAEQAGASELLRQSARDTVTAAREKLRLFGLTQTQIAAVEEGAFESDRLTIYAPIGGVVTHLAVREGDYVQTGAPIATVADLSRLWLELEAYESQLPLLRWGQRVRFTVAAHPGRTFEGRISFIEPVVDERTRTAAVRVAVDNLDGTLKPGMYATAQVQVRLAAGGGVVSDELAGRWVGPMHPTIVKDGPGQCDICGMDLVPAESLGVVGDPAAAVEPLVVPRSAVLFTGTRSVVYIEVADAEEPTYEAREVVLGPRAGEFYIVREGLAEGERVVVHGAFRIDSAMQIVAKPSMMAPDGGGSGSAHAGHGGTAADATSARPERVQVPEAFLFSLKPVYAAYLDAQEGLAADDLGRFVQAAEDLATALGFVDEVGLVGESLGAWRRALAKLRPERLVTTIDEARARFGRMSEAVIALQRRFGHHGSDDWHLGHCPMAFDNQGADWLQRGTTINNPYFGASMLRCGEIRETFPPLNALNENGDTPAEHQHD